MAMQTSAAASAPGISLLGAEGKKVTFDNFISAARLCNAGFSFPSPNKTIDLLQ
jgi:hypothetical protein